MFSFTLVTVHAVDKEWISVTQARGSEQLNPPTNDKEVLFESWSFVERKSSPAAVLNIWSASLTSFKQNKPPAKWNVFTLTFQFLPELILAVWDSFYSSHSW